MRRGKFRQYVLLVLMGTLFVVGNGPVTRATTLVSPNYQAVETDFNSGSQLETCSSSYCARSSIGSLAIGSGEAGSKTGEFGPITEDEPSLDVIVEAGASNVGTLTTETTAKTSVLVKVRNYFSDGYTLQVNGDAPHIKNHRLASPSIPTASAAGTEQFAINAVANTTPVIGSNPVQVPSGDFSFGVVDADYNTPNLFKYESGDIVARSTSESGQTEYTISMIVNVATITPAGKYSGDFSIIVVPVY